MHIERAWVSLNAGMTLLHNGFIRFLQYLNILYVLHLKDSSFLFSADVKPMCKDQEHACLLLLYVYSVISMARASLQNGG